MKRYKKYTKRKLISPYFIFAIVVLVILVMSVGYASHTEIMSIFGTANAKYDVYEINYVLNGGTNPQNAVTSFRNYDDIPLPLPTRDNFIFKGWYLNENCTGNRILSTGGLSENIILYAKWKQGIVYSQEYSYDGEYVFTGDNYINTNVFLYNQENIHKNFVISFDIVQVDPSNINHNALMNSMNETGSPWSGHVVKVSVNGNNKSLKFESNSNTSSSGDVYIPSAVKNVRVIRINDILYYSFDGRQCIKINDYNGFKDTFDVPVTFGASINGNMAPFRYFKGTLSNMSVSFIDDGARIEDFNNNNEKKDLKVKYEHKGKFVFNGENFYINTGLYLFNYEGFYKDFEISFNIDSVEPGNVQQATLVNAKNETINSFPAFVYRLYQSTDGTIKFESKGGTGSGASNKIKDVKKVKISRINSKMYLSVNDEENKQVYDFTGFTNYFSIPLTIGASLDSKGKPFRFFKGTLSDIVIKVEE